MRKILPRVLASSATLMALLAPTAGANWGYGRVETVYVEPTGSTMFVPSSYSTFVPTSYSYPVETSYVTTSYASAIPTGYLTTSATLLPASYAYTATSYSPVSTAYYLPTSSYYYRPGFFGRLLGRRPIYESTSYYIPTSTTFVDSTPMAPMGSTIATAYRGPCQESTIAFVPPTPVATPTGKGMTSRAGTGEPAYNPNAEKKRDAAVEPTKAQDPKAGGNSLTDPDAGMPSPPPAPAPDKKDEPNLEAPLPEGNPKAGDRQAMRPAATELRARAGATAQNVLRGEVVSGVSGKTVPAVKLVFSDLSGHYKDRQRETDAKGSFDVFLPNGDWSVTILDPSAAAGAQPKVVGNITSTSGKYLDDNDRPIYSLKVYN